MKKISYMRMFIEYILITFVLYLLTSFAIAVIGGWTYRSILICEEQVYPLILFYWWPAIIRMCDIYEYNKTVNKQQATPIIKPMYTL